ncbi:MAG: hypothetical protein CMJ85_01855 [Planctomycetes bacterium]|jgi:D-alanine-D-alanine ligase|nr:hypothetical protein [Planctomycetota bacterium]MDP6425094.1 hypothetical protein [Planctomycetota bacterium]
MPRRRPPWNKLPMGLSPALEQGLERASKRVYKTLGLSGYARLDFRISENEQAWFLEANPNPDIAADEEFASAAVDLDYSKLLQKLLALGLQRARGA